jgi:hypothetical protein
MAVIVACFVVVASKGSACHNIVACLLEARIVEPEKKSLLHYGCVTHDSEVSVGSGVSYVVHADSYVMQQWKNRWESFFL